MQDTRTQDTKIQDAKISTMSFSADRENFMVRTY